MYEVASLIILALGLFLIFMNWRIAYNNVFTTNKYSSWVPLMGGLLTAVGLGNSPFGDYFNGWLWIPFVLDYGCLPAVIHIAWNFMLRRHKNH